VFSRLLTSPCLVCPLTLGASGLPHSATRRVDKLHASSPVDGADCPFQGYELLCCERSSGAKHGIRITAGPSVAVPRSGMSGKCIAEWVARWMRRLWPPAWRVSARMDCLPQLVGVVLSFLPLPYHAQYMISHHHHHHSILFGTPFQSGRPY
jgi:hypothetical protein